MLPLSIPQKPLNILYPQKISSYQTEDPAGKLFPAGFSYINYCLYAHRANGDVVGAHLCVRPFYSSHKTVGADIIRPLLNRAEFKTLPSFRSATENPPPLSGEASKLNNNLCFSIAKLREIDYNIYIKTKEAEK